MSQRDRERYVVGLSLDWDPVAATISATVRHAVIDFHEERVELPGIEQLSFAEVRKLYEAVTSRDPV